MDPLTDTLVDAKKGVLGWGKITEINNDIISYGKELGKLVELRHFNGLKGNFEIIDGREYLATDNLQEVKSLPHLICSNVSEVIMQQHICL
jgi:hypothetical protein